MKKEKMQRRRARDPLHNLELGNHNNYGTSYPMRKLTRMKVVKYLILILVAVLVHTTYRLLWKTKENVSQVNVDSSEKLVDNEIQTFKHNSKHDAEKSIQDDTHNEGPDMAKLAKKRERYEQFKKLMEKERSELQEYDKVGDKAREFRKSDKIDDKTGSDFSENEKIRDKARIGYRDNEKLDDKASNEVRDNDKLDTKVIGGVERPGKDSSKENLQDADKENQNVLEQLQPIDRQQEILNLEKESKLEHQIAEALDQIKTKDLEKTEQKGEDMVAQNDKLPKEENEFLKKSNKIIEEMAPVNDDYHSDQPHGIPEIVTAATSEHFDSVKRLVYHIQLLFPKQRIYIFDLDLTDKQRRHLMAACNVRVREFWSNLFPSFVSDWSKNHWKPLVMQTALAEFGHIIWVNPGHIIYSANLVKHITKNSDFSIKVYGQRMDHTAFSVTNPTMFKYLSTDMKRIKKTPYIEIYAMVLHNTKELKENFMKYLVACALEKDCMSPPNAQRNCKFDFSGMEYAECHKFDESAMNILLYNWLDYDITPIIQNPASFMKYKPVLNNNIEMCRDENDMIARRVKKPK